jgi:hypothetical protein
MIVGTTKGGTSTLYLWLQEHSEIEFADQKELHFWCACPNPRLRAANDLGEYLTLFPSARYRGEASPCYMYYPHIAGDLKANFPTAKILMSLRDPVERFWSHYLMNEVYRPTGLEAGVLLDRILSQRPSNALDDLFGMGLYSIQVERYLKEFSSDNVHVTFLERMSENPQNVLTDVLNFLDLHTEEIDVSIRDKVYVEPKGALGRISLRNPRIRRIGVALIPPRARHYLRTRLLGSPDLKPKPDPNLVFRLRELYWEDSVKLDAMVGPVPWSWHRQSVSTTEPIDQR